MVAVRVTSHEQLKYDARNADIRRVLEVKKRDQ